MSEREIRKGDEEKGGGERGKEKEKKKGRGGTYKWIYIKIIERRKE